MALDDGYGNLAATLARLVHSPRVKYIGNSLLGTAQSQLGKPFAGSQLPNNPGSSLGTFSQHTGSTPQGGLGAVLGSLASQLNEGVQQTQDPMQQLYQQLLDQLQAPVQQPQAPDPQAIMQQIQDAVNPIYDQRAKSAEDKTGRYTKDVQGMYGQLAQEYEKLAPEQIQQAEQAQDQIKQLYGTLRSNIEGNYSRVSNEQADLFKSLGIESALPDVMEEQTAPVQDALTAASQNQAQQQQYYMDQGQTDANYYREGAPLAITTGNEKSSQLVADLQDYLQQVDAERTSAVQSGYMDQLGQAQSQYATQQQQANAETSSRQDKLWQMLQSQLQGSQQQQALTPDTFMSSLPGNVQQGVAGAFTQLERSPEAIYGKVEDKRNPVPGTYVETTPQWYMAQADQMLQQGQIDPTTYQALQMYLQLYFKQ